MSHTPGSDAVISAAERLLPGGTIEPVGERSWLVSVTTDAGRYSVRQLDPALSATRIELIHEFLAQPLLLGASTVVASDRIGSLAFDMRAWTDGEVNGSALVEAPWRSLHLPADIDLDRLGALAETVATFHRTGANASIIARAPNFKVKDGLTMARRSLDLDERRLAGEIRKESRARRWLSAARPLLTHAEQTLESAGFLRDEAPVIAHLDLSGSHIVTSDDGSNTLLDCASIGAAPAVVDIGQLIARGGSWSDERAERVLQRYADAYPLPPLQRRLLPWFTALDAIPSIGRLLVRAHDERDPVSDADRRRLFAAADVQIELLTTLAQAFVPPAPRQYRRPSRRSSRTND